MNGLFLILSLIVIGYIYYSLDYVEKHSKSELTAHQSYYKSAVFGFSIFLISLFITLPFFYLLNWVAYDDKVNLLKNIEKLPDFNIVWFFNFFVSLGLLFIYILIRYFWLFKGVNRKNKNEIYAIALTNPIDRLINNSAFLNADKFSEKLIMLSMSDKKVYIGFVFNDKNIFERFLNGQSEFVFCPIYSGYRHKDTQEVIITTDYRDEDLGKDQGENLKFQIILSRKNILTATRVDIDTLLDFTDKEDYSLNSLIEICNKKYPLLITMKNRNLYVGYLLNNLEIFSKMSEIDFLLIELKFQMIYEKDKINLSQYHDYNMNSDAFFININFKEVESITYNRNPNPSWEKGGKVDAEMLKNMFEYKLKIVSTD